MFVRFVVGSDGQHHKELTGVLTRARLLRDRGDLTAEEAARLGDVYEWFNDNVPVPPFSTGRFPRTRWHGSRTTLVNRSRGCGTSWHCYGSTVSKSGFFAGESWPSRLRGQRASARRRVEPALASQRPELPSCSRSTASLIAGGLQAEAFKFRPPSLGVMTGLEAGGDGVVAVGVARLFEPAHKARSIVLPPLCYFSRHGHPRPLHRDPDGARD